VNPPPADVVVVVVVVVGVNQPINRSPQKLHTQLREAHPSTATGLPGTDVVKKCNKSNKNYMVT